MVINDKNIESIILSTIIQKKENSDEIFLKIPLYFFTSKNFQEIYLYLKENGLSNIDTYLLQKNHEYLKTIDINSYNVSDLINYFVEVYKQRKINEIYSLTNASYEEKQRKIKEVIEEINNLSFSVPLKDKKTNIKSYLDFYKNTVQSYKQNDGLIGITTGIEELDKKIGGIKNSEYVLIAARPSMGKTSLVTKFFKNAIFDTKKEGVPVIFSLEMEAEQIMGRMIAQMDYRLSLANTLFGENSEMYQQIIEQYIQQFEEKDFYIEDFSDEGYRKLNVTPTDLDLKLAEIERLHGEIKVIIIDYLQLLSLDTRVNSQNEKLTIISAAIKALGRKYKCPVIALSQLNRELEKRQDKRPQLSDLRESGALEQDADIVMFVYRGDVYLERELKEKLKNKPNPEFERQLELLAQREFTEAEIIIGKQRNGPTGIVNAYFRKNNANFENISDNNELEEIYTQPV